LHVFACSCTRAILFYSHFAAYCNIAAFLSNVYLRGEGEGVRPVLYNFRGSEVLLYNVVWGGRLSKNQHFLCYIICGRPLTAPCHTESETELIPVNFGVLCRYYTVPDTSGAGYCFRSICLFLYFFVSLLARLRENVWTDLHEIFREGAE